MTLRKKDILNRSSRFVSSVTSTQDLPAALRKSFSGQERVRGRSKVKKIIGGVVATAATLGYVAALENSGKNTLQSDASDGATYDGLSFLSHMVAGSAAGMMEHLAMYPVDTIKTQMQAARPPHAMAEAESFRVIFSRVLKSDGLVGLYRGVGAVAIGAGPVHALHFAVYEMAKEALGGNKEGLRPVETALAGCTATMVSDAVMTPVDCIKQRCQVANSPYRGVWKATKNIVQTEGVSALFRSYRATVLMNVPFTAMHFSVYETSKKLLLNINSEEEEETLKVQLIAGGLGGGAAAAVTVPLDVVKTRLQLDCACQYRRSSVVSTLKQIVREEGVRALWTGLKPRVLFHVPAAAICWGTYETAKDMLKPK
mmetsp:Transcript_22897/g.40470  ORF Transcript_22897/g.40470 Transcript_22897/m.40470 type:complete len:370 (-) Transcript_22897:1171-2280(-)|eukprot:CAMPEP_0175080102 /NCGR_PEP_ID=MMETSP0052_2-20121109/25279_1 /TAXON_ID=51329 ORGANISM="Polytomella parva, Strain SAG 63-3" /NCGR_SAMPLE_ID=MMETSP0052_2 /ASSEMBLY_ACC=CAM_ASM_000194 /LENGTH=369 /DNA_ID=CAMNT_0016350681 /DNA_START=98 /DNA_END=1207 /DNA_ORIENTATION=-